jgi:hypothetical protein
MPVAKRDPGRWRWVLFPFVVLSESQVPTQYVPFFFRFQSSGCPSLLWVIHLVQGFSI